jgi:hypothetical protein
VRCKNRSTFIRNYSQFVANKVVVICPIVTSLFYFSLLSVEGRLVDGVYISGVKVEEDLQ